MPKILILKSMVLFTFLFVSTVAAQSSRVTVQQAKDTLGVYEIFELTFQFGGLFKNPWEYADIEAEFIHFASKDTLSVGGFYYHFDLWKVRFAPIKTGNWSYRYRFSVHDELIAKGAGQFIAIPSHHPGFVRISSENPFRCVFDNQEPFYPLGFGSCNNSNKFGYDGPDRWKLPTTKVVDEVEIDFYFESFGEAGFNIYRWSDNNCGYSIIEKIGVHENIYKIKESRLLDELLQTAVKNGFRIIYCPFNTDDLTRPEFVSDSLKVNAVKKYLKYCVDRWGAWVDIWEFFNEKSPSREWFDILVPYMHEIDPYRHILTSNPSHMASDLFDILTFHHYENMDNTIIDKSLVGKKNKTLGGFKKPMIFTEYGNKRPYSNYHPLRYRVFIWTAFTNQAHLVFWNNSFAKYDTGGVAQYTNVYLGPEERPMTKIHTHFIAKFPLRHKNIDLEVSQPNKVRAHTLQADDDLIAYFYYFADRPNTKSGREEEAGPRLKNMTVKVPVPEQADHAAWVNPATGKVLNSFEIEPGLQLLNVPDFQIDIALRVSRRERIEYMLNADSLVNLILN